MITYNLMKHEEKQTNFAKFRPGSIAFASKKNI